MSLTLRPRNGTGIAAAWELITESSETSHLINQLVFAMQQLIASAALPSNRSIHKSQSWHALLLTWKKVAHARTSPTGLVNGHWLATAPDPTTTSRAALHSQRINVFVMEQTSINHVNAVFPSLSMIHKYQLLFAQLTLNNKTVHAKTRLTLRPRNGTGIAIAQEKTTWLPRTSTSLNNFVSVMLNHAIAV